MNTDPAPNQPVTAPPKPVAYDSEGRPLYAAPPTLPTDQPVQVVQLTRPLEPTRLEASPEAKARHEESVANYPSLDLSEGEYVISSVHRHPIGLAAPIAVTALLVVAILFGMMALPALATTLGLGGAIYGPLFVGGILLIALVLLGGYAAVWVYNNNHFILTNESVIQETQTSLFSRNQQTASLENIEDVSYDQRGIWQTMLNYGSIRLSTEGNETTYRFSYVAEPKKQVAVLNNAVESFKNGRPVNQLD